MYDAFISYRHTELDKFAAETLHRQLEAFRLPAVLAKKTRGKKKLERVFRDKDELPLTSNLEDPITKALAESEYLIVICSPRLRESLWCKKEIETFISLHGREKILAVLIEGEPAEAFPEELLFCEETVTLPDDSVETRRRELEPLAADIRGKTKREMKKAMRTELLRLLAPMFSVSYDDLRQRHREQRLHRILTASLAAGAVCLAFGAVSTAMALRIQGQKEQIQTQNEEILSKTEEITRQNAALLEAQAQSMAEEALRLLEEGDRRTAVETAREALTDYDGIALPVTPTAMLALSRSLHVYDNSSTMKPLYQIVTESLINQMVLSPDRIRLLTLEDSGCLTLWNLETEEQELQFQDCGTRLTGNYIACFVGDRRIAYIGEDGRVKVYNLDEKSLLTLDIAGSYVYGIRGAEEADCLLVQENNGVELFDVTNGSVQGACTTEDNMVAGCVYWDEKTGLIVFGTRDREDQRRLTLYNYKEGRIVASQQVGELILETVKFEADRVYVLLNDYTEQEQSAVLMVYEQDTGSLLWKNEFAGGVGKLLYLPAAEEAENLMLTTAYGVRLVNLADGSETCYFPVGEESAGGGSYVNKDAFIFFTRDGTYHYLNVGNMTEYNMDYIFVCPDHNVKVFMVCDEGFLVLPYLSNRITLYNYSNRDGLKEVTTPVELPEGSYAEYSELEELAEEIGIPDGRLARYAFYNDDKSLLFVSYRGDRFVIYDAESMEQQAAFSDMPDDFCYYFGKDQEGNLYVGGLSNAYALTPDYEVLFQIEGMIGLDAEQGCLFVDNTSGKQYTIPIYTREELLALADEMLGE